MEMNVDESKLVSNSGTSKDKKDIQKRVDKPVVSGKVSKRNKPLIKRIVEAFVGDDVGDVKGYLIYDVLIPSVKDTFSTMVSTGVNMILFGEARRPDKVSRNGARSYVDYGRSYYGSTRRLETRPLVDPNPRKASFNRRAAHEFDDILFESRQDAEEVLSHLVDLIEIYDCATVADLYDLVGQTAAYTDRGFGWYELGSACVKRIRDGYILELPKVQEL